MADLGTTTLVEQTSQSVKLIVFSWLSENGGGDAGKATKTTVEYYDGALETAYFVPGGTTPTNLWDVTITDANGLDVLNALGANLSNAANTIKHKSDGLLPIANSKLTMAVSGAGNAKNGTIYLYIR